MNCDQHLDLLGLDDDELTQEEAARLGEHLAVCETCRAEREEALLGRAALGRFVVPPLSEQEVSRVVAAAMPMGARRAPRWVSWASHAAALLLGLLLARSWSAGPSVAEPEVREVRVEVPIEVPVEVPVKVEVEVEKVVYRDRVVPHPLQARWDAQLAFANTMGEAGLLALQGFERTLTRLANDADNSVSKAGSKAGPEPAVIAEAKPPRRARALVAAASSSQAHVEVRRRDGRVTLVTRGALPDVVPVLIDTLETGEEDVRTAAFDRLQSIRADFGEDGLALSMPSKNRARPGGIRGLLSQGEERAPAPTALDPALWRDWWNRQQAASGLTSSTTSI